MMTRRYLAILALALALALPLTACTMGRPKERINPPGLSIQELRIDGGDCTFLLRVQNHSTVTMRYSTLSFEHFTVDGRELAPLTLTPALDVPTFTGEPFAHEMPCPTLTAGASELVYHLEGRIEADAPRSQGFRFDHRSRLLPVPGLTGVYR